MLLFFACTSLFRLHELRHSCASLLLANGVSLKQIQEWLGHSTFTITADTYAHLEFSSKLQSAQAMTWIEQTSFALPSEDVGLVTSDLHQAGEKENCQLVC